MLSVSVKCCICCIAAFILSSCTLQCHRLFSLTLQTVASKLFTKFQLVFLFESSTFAKKTPAAERSLLIISPLTSLGAASYKLTLTSCVPCSSCDSSSYIPPSPAKCIFKNSSLGLDVPRASVSLSMPWPLPASVFHWWRSLALSHCMIVLQSRE